MTRLSFVIPCYKSSETIRDVYDEIRSVMAEKADEYSYEIIAVNDASPDDTLSVLREIAAGDPSFRVIDFARNMGKHSALLAGMRYADGEYVTCLDDDGQCPMDHFWELLAPAEGSYDVSIAKYGVKAQSFKKNIGSWANAFMMTYMLGKPKEIQFANFFVMKRFIVDELIRYPNPYCYINGLILRTTHNIANVPMKERARTRGEGNYTLCKSLKLWLNGFTAFSIVPLRIATLFGFLFSAVGFITVIVLIIRKLLHPGIAMGYTSILATIIFIGGIIMIMLGLLGEYIGRSYICINRAPQYVVRSAWNVPGSGGSRSGSALSEDPSGCLTGGADDRRESKAGPQ